jgi:tetratricopeptide (TPR) repeat protein
MAYHEEEQLKFKRMNTKQAIAFAMQGKWKDAININKAILEIFPDDVDTYNRLGRAFMETGSYGDARRAYEKSLGLDAYNTIAKKNLARLTQLKEAPAGAKSRANTVEPHFVEEAGKSGVLNLHRLPSSKILARLVAGDQVFLKAEQTKMLVKSGQGEYIGEIEPRHAQRLIKLMKGGNKYSAAIISASDNKVTVIIRETYQHPNLVGQPSFPPRWAEGLHQYTGLGSAEEEEEEEEEQPGTAYEEEEEAVEEYSSSDGLDSE